MFAMKNVNPKEPAGTRDMSGDLHQNTKEIDTGNGTEQLLGHGGKIQQTSVTDGVNRCRIIMVFVVEILLIVFAIILLITAIMFFIAYMNGFPPDTVYMSPSTESTLPSLPRLTFILSLGSLVIAGLVFIVLLVMVARFIVLLVMVARKKKPLHVLFDHRRTMLGIKFFMHGFLFVWSLAGVMFIVFMACEVNSKYQTDLKSGVEIKEHTNDTDADAVRWLSYIQNKSSCCGSLSYDDYSMPPPSCCNVKHENLRYCRGKRADKHHTVPVDYYQKGCFPIVKSTFDEWFTYPFLPYPIVQSLICFLSLCALIVVARLSKRRKQTPLQK